MLLSTSAGRLASSSSLKAVALEATASSCGAMSAAVADELAGASTEMR
jgi:hypothetical protein